MSGASDASGCWWPAFSGVATVGANMSIAIANAVRDKKKVIELEAKGICIELLRVEPAASLPH